MSALDNMLGDMLRKAIPPEIMELLTPEKLSEFGDKINGYIVDTRERLERIEQKLERLDNVERNNSNSSGNGSEPEPGPGSDAGSGSGSDTGSN